MRLSVVVAGIIGAVVVVGTSLRTTPAHAIKEFEAEFEARYLNRQSRKRLDVALVRAVDQAKCSICHPGNDKHKFTAYGAAVALNVNRYDKGKKDSVREAFDQAGARRSDPQNPKSPTFGTMIKRGKLPVAPWE
jgi:hypothetical protein